MTNNLSTFKLSFDEYIREQNTTNRRLLSINSFNFQLLESITYDAPQGIVQYESVGEDGGATKNTGRKIESLTLTGKLLNKYVMKRQGNDIVLDVNKSYSDIRRELFEIKDNGVPCELSGHPYMNFKTRKWVISNINTGLNSGQNYLTFSISLVEYRQANIRKTTLSLVNNKDLLDFKTNLAITLAGQ